MAASLPQFASILRTLCRVSRSITNRDTNEPAPCDQLAKDIAAQGDRFIEQQTRIPGMNEYRLNGEDLKLQYQVDYYRDGDRTNVYIVDLRIQGERMKAYPEFVREAESILRTANNPGETAFTQARAA